MNNQLDIDTGHQLQLTPNDLVGQRIAILGISGSGKTNTAAVLIEEMLTRAIPLTIVDIEGEYWGLKERYDLLIAGRSAAVDLEVGVDQAAQLAEFSLKQRVTVVLDLSEFKLDDAFEFLLAYFDRLWELASLDRKPYGIVLEEASEFIPQGAGTPLKNILKTIASRGRKKGLSLTVVNQRATTLEKNVLTQATLLFLHNVRYPSDLKVYQEIIPLPSREVETMVKDLKPGQAIALFHGAITVIQVRLRHTFHAGSTPGLDSSDTPTLRKLDSRMLEQLREALSQPASASTDDRDRQIADLTRKLAAAEKELSELRARPPQSVTSMPKPAPVVIKPTVQATPSSPAIDQRATARLDSAQQRNRTRQANAFQRVLGQLKGKSRKDQLETLLFLAANEDRGIALEEIARRLGYRVETLKMNPPRQFFRMGWIERTAGKLTYCYRSKLTQRLKEDYPDLDTKALIEQLHRLV